MQRRKLLALGAGAGLLLAVTGGALALLRSPRPQGRLTDDARQMMSAVATAVLYTALPADAGQRARALEGHIARLQTAIAGLPPAMQSEVDQLIAVLTSSAGRLGLARLTAPWAEATPQQLQVAMQGLRESSLALRQQTYRALRDLTNSSYFAEPATWQQAMGYPGPRAI